MGEGARADGLGSVAVQLPRYDLQQGHLLPPIEPYIPRFSGRGPEPAQLGPAIPRKA